MSLETDTPREERFTPIFCLTGQTIHVNVPITNVSIISYTVIGELSQWLIDLTREHLRGEGESLVIVGKDAEADVFRLQS